MSLMYTIKCISQNGDQYCHPCCGPYRIERDNSQQCSGYMLVLDCEEGVHFSTADYQTIYIENADGKTINLVRGPELKGGVIGAGVP